MHSVLCMFWCLLIIRNAVSFNVFVSVYVFLMCDFDVALQKPSKAGKSPSEKKFPFSFFDRIHIIICIFFLRNSVIFGLQQSLIFVLKSDKTMSGKQGISRTCWHF